jgi:hypothetical protein
MLTTPDTKAIGGGTIKRIAQEQQENAWMETAGLALERVVLCGFRRV